MRLRGNVGAYANNQKRLREAIRGVVFLIARRGDSNAASRSDISIFPPEVVSLFEHEPFP